ncbi:hypothetical protein NEAUS03_2301, partial [Nematocida ausubeli]
MEIQAAESNRQNSTEVASGKERKRGFGLPAGMVQHFADRGIAQEELAQMGIDEVLAQTGQLEGKALNKAVQTVLKTTRSMEQLRTRLEMLTGYKGTEDVCTGVLNSVLHAHRHTLYAGGPEGVLEYAYTLVIDAEHANVKHVGRVLLAHAPAEDAAVVALVQREMERFFPDTEGLGPGEEERMEKQIFLFSGTKKSREALREYISVRAEALCVLAKRCESPLPVWKRVLAIYKKVHKETVPEEKVRALGLAVLRTQRGEQALVEATSQYVQSMRTG